jgi:serine protease AprX
MTSEIVEAARARVSNAWGEKLGRKATAAFCLAYGQPAAPVMFAAAEAAAVRPETSGGVILEFTDQPEVSDAIDEAVESLRNSKSWSAFRKELKKVQVRPVKSGTVREVMETGRSEPELLPLHAARLLRHLKVMALRDNFFKVAGPITDSIERQSHGFAHRALTGATSRAAITEVCWLNGTVRSWSDPRALAEAAADESIETIDLPRTLRAEVNISAQTVGAPHFSKKFKKGGKGIIVAVIDGEVALTHPALKGRVVHKMNFTDEPWGNPDFHGTAIAGIIASNDSAFAGMATEATLYNYKVLATNKSLTGADFDGSLAIQQALEDGAQIANCSWGVGEAGDGTSREARACNRAWKAGLVVVKSAGNDGPGSSTMTTPADADGVIVVGATDREGSSVQDYSSRGPAGTKNRPHLVAPGGIRLGVGITSCLVGGGFGDTGAGSSYAAPHVAGLVALLLERNPALTPDAVRDLLLGACTPLAATDINTGGKGLLSLSQVI